MSEISIARAAMCRQMMGVPHRNLHGAVYDFRSALADDPYFAARLAVWINRPESGHVIRDTQEAAIISLLQSREYREAGRATLLGRDVYPASGMPGLPPFRILRVVCYMASPYIVQADEGEVLGHYMTRGAADRAARDGQHVTWDSGHVQAARLMHAVFEDWLAVLEGNVERADGVMLRNRRWMARLWRHHHIPGRKYPTLEAFIFGEPPEGTRCWWVRHIAGLTDPTDQAKLVVEHHIPYTLATSVIRVWTPGAKLALVDAMTPQEALNSVSWIERSGLLDNPLVRRMFTEKVAQARASAATAQHRRSARARTAEVRQAVAHATQAAVEDSRQVQAIERPTVVLMDRSGSMDNAIQAARELCAHIAARVKGPFEVVAFNTNAMPLDVGDMSLEALERAFAHIRATGGTSIGVGLREALQRMPEPPEQVVVVTDTGENQRPWLVDVANQALVHMVTPPTFVFIILPGDRGRVVDQLREAGFQVDEFRVEGGDYYIFDQVAALLSGPMGKSLVDLVLETPLPEAC